MRFLALLAFVTAASPAFATSCLEKTWELRASAPNHAHMSPGLDRESAAYQCQVAGTRGQASAYLHAVETLTQRRAGYCLPWAMAAYQAFVVLDRAYYLGLGATRELDSHRACIDWLRDSYSATPATAAFSCFYARIDGKMNDLRACLASFTGSGQGAGQAALYACHESLFGGREGCNGNCH